MDNTKPFPILSFKGGYCGNIPPNQLQLNQAQDLDNIVVKPGGLGIRSRLGNAKLNSNTLNSSANIQGIYRFLLSSGTSYIMAVAGNKLYQLNPSSGSETDITGSVTITSGADNHWDMVTFNDAVIGFGGSSTAPDAPWRWTGSGNAAALTGTPPSAYGGFTANNRVFAFRTSSSPSTIYWSIIGNAQDWTGSGSGSAVIGSLADNQAVTAAMVISTNYVLVFKENSTYQMVISSAPFPVYTLYDNVGCVGKHACVNVDGEVYFITKQKRMCSTNGETLKTYPEVADDLWGAVQQSRLPYVQGYRQRGVDYDWLVWCVSTTGSTNNTTIIWDLINECWLKCSTGADFNIGYTDYTDVTYGGGYDGFIYKQDQSATYADASESGAAIASYWRSGWLNPGSGDTIIQVRKMIVQLKTKASGSITVNYGFDFIADSASFTLSQVATSTESYTSRQSVLSRRGNFFQFKIGLTSSTIDYEVASLILRGKEYGQKKISAS